MNDTHPLICFYFFFILLVKSEHGKAQTYFPFPKDSARWEVCNIPVFGPPLETSYTLDGTEVIDGVIYTRVFLNSFEPNFLIREDSSRSVYYRFPSQEPSLTIGYSLPLDQDIKLYDFADWQVGDTIVIDPELHKRRIYAIDSILVGDSYRRQLHFTPIYDGAGFYLEDSLWIDGIGSTKGLLMPLLYEFEVFYCLWEFQDYHPENSDTFSHQFDQSCYDPNRIAELVPPSFMTLFPNPADEMCTISLKLNGLKTVNQFDSQGILKQSINTYEKELQLNLTGLESGLYFIQCQVDDKIELSKLLVTH